MAIGFVSLNNASLMLSGSDGVSCYLAWLRFVSLNNGRLMLSGSDGI